MSVLATIRRLARTSPGAEERGDSSQSRERNRRAMLTGAAALAARGVQVGTALITIPLTIHYLGKERFGLWMTISSVLAMANFADFGIGNGLLNTVADAYGKDDYARIQRAVSSGFAVLCGVGAVLLLLFAASFAWIPWADVFKVSGTQARAEAAPALFIFAACFALNIPLDVVQRVQLGLQRGFEMNLWQMAGSLLALGGVIAAIHAHVGLPLLVLALAGAPVVMVGLNSLHFFFISRPELRPSWHRVSREVTRRILRLGGSFFVLQLGVAVSYSADNFIIARVMGAANVPEYSIPQRMFSLISVAMATLMTPLWPAYGEAVSRGDMNWVRRTLVRSLLFAIGGAAFASTVLLFSAHQLIAWWVGPGISPPFFLLLGLSLWTVVDCLGNALAMFLNGASLMRFQIVLTPVFGVGCLALKILLTRRFGLIGVPWATLLAHLVIVEIALAIYIPLVLGRLHHRPSEISIATPVIEE